MHVISRKALTEFWKLHADVEMPLRTWFRAATQGTFRNLVELKKTFGTVDYVPARNGALYVFNLGGNKCRLVAAIHFNTQKVFIRKVLTHKDYDRGDWRK